MPGRIAFDMAEELKDKIAVGGAGATGMAWAIDINVLIQMGVGSLTCVFLMVRIVHWVRHWSTPPTRKAG